MRLIDADALKEEIAVGKEHIAKHQDPAISLLTYVIDGFSALVDKKPTIDAITVEWLIDRANDPERAPLYRRYAQMLYEEWQKEQEAQK